MAAAHADEPPRPPRTLSRREILGWGAALVPAGLVVPQWAHSQSVTEAPLAPREALGDLEHRFWKDLLDAFPLEPEENHFDNAEVGIPPLQSLAHMARVARDVSAHADATASDHVDTARQRAARSFGAQVEEILFASSATDAMRVVAEALPLPPGAVVALSAAEPPSSLRAWQAMERMQRVRIKRFETHERDGTLRNPRKWLDDAAVVVLSHALSTTGAVLPLDEVSEEARRRNVWVVANGSHAAGIVPLDVHALGVDAYVASGSGWMLGPRGTALAFARAERLAELVVRDRPMSPNSTGNVYAGATGVQAARELEVEPANASLVAGLAASLEWLDGIGITTVRDHAAQLALRMHAGVEGVSGLDVLSSADDIARCPTLAVRVRRRPNTQVAEWLLENLRMSVHRVDTAGLNAIRASPHVVNRPDEIDWFIEGMRALA